ncbi:hypothetical protein MLD38_003698 [Melastoma candidum]|uniref:Uncharacterized protein n=1 Tax=Melastoma candidum TaxID=119954 RepID=A0ACB9S3P9_9MYRT|nr:hypothetical protein MLD38_003698 [Melastoma candidum]
METSIAVHDHSDDDFIDMDVTSYSNFFCRKSAASPLHQREFEFQMSSSSLDKETTTSPPTSFSTRVNSFRFICRRAFIWWRRSSSTPIQSTREEEMGTKRALAR